MTRDDFWRLIEAHVEPGDELDLGALQEALEEGGADLICAFGAHFNALHRESYNWALWGAAYLANGGCSDDAFDYFRAWLIGQGRDVYARLLADPDALADITDGDVGSEDLLAVAWDAYQRVTGEKLPVGAITPLPDLGEGWDFDDETESRRRYPKLSRKFLG